jgi:hypothetical protein
MLSRFAPLTAVQVVYSTVTVVILYTFMVYGKNTTTVSAAYNASTADQQLCFEYFICSDSDPLEVLV